MECLEVRARCLRSTSSDDLRSDIGHCREVANGQALEESWKRLCWETSLCHSWSHILWDESASLGGQDRDEQRLRDSAADTTNGTEHTSGKTDIMSLKNKGDTWERDVVDVADEDRAESAQDDRLRVCIWSDAGQGSNECRADETGDDGLPLDIWHVRESEAAHELTE